VAGQLKAIPSPFVWNVDETRVGCPKKTTRPGVIISINTKPGSFTVPEERDDTQLTLLTAIAAFGDSTCPLFISKLKTLEKTLFAAQKRYEGHDYAIRSAPQRLSQKFFSLTDLTQVFCRVFLISGGNSTTMGRAF
jgi:hypothetical protein